MLIWNVKDSCLKAVKTEGLFFSFGDEVPEDEINNPERVAAMLKRGWLIEKKAKAPAPKAEPMPEPKPVHRPRPLPLPKKTESKPKPKPKAKKKGRK